MLRLSSLTCRLLGCWLVHGQSIWDWYWKKLPRDSRFVCVATIILDVIPDILQALVYTQLSSQQLKDPQVR